MLNLPEKDLRELVTNLHNLNQTYRSPWVNFGKGLLAGLGSVVGAGLAIILIGWFLNVIGVIPAFQRTATDWRDAFLQVQNSDAKSFVVPEVPSVTE